jgi:acyl-CoA thioesterase I
MNHSSKHIPQHVDITRRTSLLSFLSLCTMVGATGSMSLAHAATARAQSKGPQTILVLGDSLSAEYGLARGTGWVTLLGQKLANRPEVSVVNASISGETTSGGLRRLPALLKQHKPTHVIIGCQ